MIRLLIAVLCVISLAPANLNAGSAEEDWLAIEKLSVEIGKVEDRGDRKWLENILSEDLAFLRESGLDLKKKGTK